MSLYIDWKLYYSEIDGYQLNIINATNRKKTNANYITTNRRYTLFDDKLINFNPNQIYYTKTKVGKINKDTDKFLCVITELFNYRNEKSIQINIYTVKATCTIEFGDLVSRYVDTVRLMPEWYLRLNEEIKILDAKEFDGFQVIKNKIKSNQVGYTDKELKIIDEFNSFNDFCIDWLIKKRKSIVKDIIKNKRIVY